jgi:hypothetical protein
MSESLSLSREEQAVLGEILSREIETTRGELHHTDDHTYRRIVKRHLDLARQILGKLQDLPGEYESAEGKTMEGSASPRGEA